MHNPHWQNTHNHELKSLHKFKDHAGSVETVRFCPHNQNKFYSGSHDHTIKQWDVSTLQCLKTLNVHNLGVWCLDPSPTSKLLASTSPDARVLLTDTNTDKVVMNFKGNFSKGYWVEFSNDGDKLVASGMDGCIQLYDIKKGSLYKEHRMDSAIVYNSKFISNDRILCCTSEGEILLFDDNLNVILQKKMTEHEIRSISVKDKRLFTSFYDNKVKGFDLDLANNTVELANEFDAHLDIVNVIRTAPNCGTLFTGSKDSALHAWDLDTCAFKNNLVGHIDQISDISIQQGGKLLVSASWDQSLRLYDISAI